MRRGYFTVILLLAVIGLSLWWRHDVMSTYTTTTPETTNQMGSEAHGVLNEWRTPIEFYGLVLDEKTNPVSDADVHFVWTDLSVGGSSDKDATSDTNGRFSLKNVRGKHLMVKVSKNDYYAYQPFGMGFFYAGENQNFIPDVNNPVIFRLKRKGIAEPLVVFDKDFQLPISGRPLELSLRTGQVVSSGQGNVILSFEKAPIGQTTRRTYDWSFTISVPNGGLVLSTNEFAFQAPENGYAPTRTLEMKSAPEEAWESRIRREYYVKLPDRTFARVEFDLMTHNGSLRMQAFVNPSGSRNLEFDPNKVVGNR